PSVEGIYGQVSDLEIQAAEVQRMRDLLEATLAKHTGRSKEQIATDIDRDKILTAEQAVEHGIVDEVLPYRKLSAMQQQSGLVARASCGGPGGRARSA